MLSDFHFLRPELLLCVPALIAIIWLWMRLRLSSSEWQSILPQHLHQRLVSNKSNKQSRQAFIWLMLALSIASIAAAGPAWEKLPQPVYQSNSGRVVVMDMSLSMRATDVTPSRLARAKFKAIDLVNEINDGEVGLVAYAGDAFIISPLTDDISNLENLIPSLSPEIMPNSGSNPSAGLLQAIELLDNAGYQTGHIYWITDGIEYEDVKPIRDLLNDTQYQFSALTIGTDEGAPISMNDGSLLKDYSGAIVIPKVNSAFLDDALSPSNGRQTRMSIDDTDIKSMLLTSRQLDAVKQENNEQNTGDAWRDMGAYLVLLILPIALFMFRKGVLFCLVLTAFTPLWPDTAYAQQPTNKPVQDESKNTSLTERAKCWFLNSNQKGAEAFNNENYQDAAELFKDINWRAAAAYKAGDYETALSLYQQSDGLNSIYNSANALAQLGQLEEAIDTYARVLKLDPEHKEAAKNKTVLEELLEQQQQQQQDQQQGDQGDNSESSDQADSQNGQDNSQQSNSGQQGDTQGEGGEEQNSDGEQSEGENKPDEEQSPENSGQSEQSQQDSQGSGESEQGPLDEMRDAQGEQQYNGTEQSSALPQEQENVDEQENVGSVQAIDQSELTPEEREQMQRLQTLMNKVPDDPAYLLQRKMLIEAQRRKQFAPPTKNEQEW
ncbi:VWA domain-containing protein [Glaciecola siphonariae]|uniref:VWA domain-containing protein n=1 Tax=Glaciecola siphonariae TaxID=521012 RepID=A0ABV9LSN6_9ALTE